jgi:integrase
MFVPVRVHNVVCMHASKINTVSQSSSEMCFAAFFLCGFLEQFLSKFGFHACMHAEGIALAALEPTKEKGQWEATLLDYAWKLKKRGLAETTIAARTYRLRVLAKKGADLNNPDSVETVLATEPWTQANKHFFVMAYQSYTKTMSISWTPIKIRSEPKQPFIPLESEIDQLIAGCGKKTATFLQTLKETGARCGEVSKLKWTDINEKNNTIAINSPEKGSNSRTIKISGKLIAMLNALPKNKDFVFNTHTGTLQSAFLKQRNKLAITLQNPRIKQIHFHTFRHWKATTEYHKTRDLPFVKHLLGHKHLTSTEVYMHLVNFESDEWTSNVAKTVEEACKLVEAGFEYVTEIDGTKIFRKRK